MRFHRLFWSAAALLAVCAFQERHHGKRIEYNSGNDAAAMTVRTSVAS